MSKKGVRSPLSLLQAFDEAKFGPQRTLNLRASMPSEVEAVRRAEAWLREQQVAGAGDVLIITGRGRGSPGGTSVVREGVHRLLLSLRRRGVVASLREHTAGSFVVTLARMTALLEAPRRKRETPIRPALPEALKALTPETLHLLRTLSILSLGALGVADADRYIEKEMLRQFAALSSGAPRAPADRDAAATINDEGAPATPAARAAREQRDPEAQLRRALRRALDEYFEQ